MSSSRSIAAARQRRAGEPAPISQQRPPVTSINSQKAFAPQQQQESFISYLNDQTTDAVSKLNSIYQINEFDVSSIL